VADLGRRGRRPGQRGGLRPPAWRPWRRRRISAAASRPRRGRPAIAAVLGRQRRDRGEGGGAAADLCRLRGRPKRRDRGTAPRRGSRASVAAGSPASRSASVETVAKAVEHRGGSRLPASRPRRGRRATAAELGRRRRDRGEGGGPLRQILVASVETVAKAAGHRGGSGSPASTQRPLRGQRAEDFLDVKTPRSVLIKFQMLYIM